MLLKPKYTISLVEEHGRHFYTVDGTNLFLPSSTTVLGKVLAKPILVPWAVKMTGEYFRRYLTRVGEALNPKQTIAYYKDDLTKKHLDRLIKRAKRQYKYERDRAADLGTRAHEHIDNFTKGVQDDPKEDTNQAIENWEEWKGKTKLKIVRGNTKICSIKWGFGGSLDAIGEDPTGRLFIVDYKTSNFSDISHAYQVASYAQAFKETFDLDYLPSTYIIRFDKAKKHWEERKIKDTQKALQGFLSVLEVYNQLSIDHFQITATNHEAKANEKLKKLPKRGGKTKRG